MHWNKAANPTGYFDAWFLNLFPRETPWTFHRGGYGSRHSSNRCRRKRHDPRWKLSP